MIQNKKPMMFSPCKYVLAKGLGEKYYTVINQHQLFDFFDFFTFLNIPKGTFFDSSMSTRSSPCWSFFGVQPGEKITQETDHPTDFLDKVQQRLHPKTNPLPTELAGIPFIAGYTGYISYEKSFEKNFEKKASTSTFPDYQFQYFDGSISFNHTTKQLIIITGKKDIYQTIIDQLQHFISNKPTSDKAEAVVTGIKAQLSKNDYIKNVEQILENIKCGNIYQANFTHQLTATFKGDPLILYKALREFNPAPYSCFHQVSENQFILSSSPERLFKVLNNTIVSNPIKGTINRKQGIAQDNIQKETLLNSKKDRAELAMIIDLIRNDLGRICQFGSVKVNHWPTLKTFKKVHHLIGEIQGELKPNTTINELFSSLFPGGSITGAPKIRSMKIIDTLEKPSRGPYTGSIGYLDLRGNMEFNILIRTILIEKDHLTLQVGGGIVIDSDPIKEYEESMHKAEAILDALNHLKQR